MSRPDVSEERRPQIVEAAIRVFTRKGYHKATMPEIAQEAGLSIGGIYWYFKSKDEIVTAIMARLFQHDLAALAILLNADAPAADRLRAFVAQYVAFYEAYVWLNPIGVQVYAEATHAAAAQAFVQKYLGDYRQALATLIDQGIQRGEFRPVNPQDTANALLGLEEGLSLILAVDPQNVRWQAAFQVGIALILAGLTCPATAVNSDDEH